MSPAANVAEPRYAQSNVPRLSRGYILQRMSQHRAVYISFTGLLRLPSLTSILSYTSHSRNLRTKISLWHTFRQITEQISVDRRNQEIAAAKTYRISQPVDVSLISLHRCICVNALLSKSPHLRRSNPRSTASSHALLERLFYSPCCPDIESVSGTTRKSSKLFIRLCNRSNLLFRADLKGTCHKSDTVPDIRTVEPWVASSPVIA